MNFFRETALVGFLESELTLLIAKILSIMSNSCVCKEPTGKKSEVRKHVLVDKDNDSIIKCKYCALAKFNAKQEAYLKHNFSSSNLQMQNLIFSNSLQNLMEYFTINFSYGLTKKLSKS